MELKIRLYSKNLNQFFYMGLTNPGDYINIIKSTDGKCYIKYNDEVIEVETSVWIGIKDKNGIDIYERDILKGERIGEVVFDTREFCIKYSESEFKSISIVNRFEIIGNAFQVKNDTNQIQKPVVKKTSRASKQKPKK